MVRTTWSGRGWQITVPSGWIAVDGETAAMVKRELDGGDDGDAGFDLVMVREADGADSISLMTMEIDEEWMDEVAVKEMGEELAATVKEHFGAVVSPVHDFRVSGEPAAAFDYFVEHESGRIANRQGFFVGAGVAYYLFLANGSGEAGAKACLAAYDEIVREWKWAPVPEAAATE